MLVISLSISATLGSFALFKRKPLIQLIITLMPVNNTNDAISILDKISMTARPVKYINTPATKVDTVEIKSKNECKNTA